MPWQFRKKHRFHYEYQNVKYPKYHTSQINKSKNKYVWFNYTINLFGGVFFFCPWFRHAKRLTHWNLWLHFPAFHNAFIQRFRYFLHQWPWLFKPLFTLHCCYYYEAQIKYQEPFVQKSLKFPKGSTFSHICTVLSHHQYINIYILNISWKKDSKVRVYFWHTIC